MDSWNLLAIVADLSRRSYVLLSAARIGHTRHFIHGDPCEVLY
jgi:hypothetical protein